MTEKQQIRLLIDYLKAEKYAFISAQGKILLHHTPTNTDHGTDILRRLFKLVTGARWQQHYLDDLLVEVPFIMGHEFSPCLLYTSPSPRDATLSRMPSSA